MIKAILGKKLNMTQVFDADGNLVPVTVIDVGSCCITQVKGLDKDKYAAIQLGYGSKKRKTKALIGHFKAINLVPKFVREIRSKDGEDIKDVAVGQKIGADIFASGDMVSVVSVTKAKGFAGGIKRHKFKSHPAGHGHPMERKVGSIGSGYPQHVMKGKKLPGRMGPRRQTVKNLEVFDIDSPANLLFIKGSIPGSRGAMVIIKALGAK